MKKVEYEPAWNPKYKGPKPKITNAYEFGVPGLVGVKSGKNWNIDHSPSGYNVINGWFTKRKDAAEAALVAQDKILIDWTKPREQLPIYLAEQWYEILKWGYVQPSITIADGAEPYIHNWTYVELTSFAMDGVSEGLCGACGEVSGNHEPDAVGNWCPCCGEKEVTSALVMAGMI